MNPSSNPRSMHSTIDHTDEDEVKLCEVARHPFGIVIVYVLAFIGVFLGLGLSYFLLPQIFEDSGDAFAIANVFALIIIIIASAVIMLSSVVYRQNRLIVTDRNITQILQYGLFSRKVSQLNLVNVEDVTASQKGLWQTIFGFGTVTIETAGEQSNFSFIYCPRPGYYAKIILEARENILGQHDGDHRVDAGFTTTR